MARKGQEQEDNALSAVTKRASFLLRKMSIKKGNKPVKELVDHFNSEGIPRTILGSSPYSSSARSKSSTSLNDPDEELTLEEALRTISPRSIISRNPNSGLSRSISAPVVHQAQIAARSASTPTDTAKRASKDTTSTSQTTSYPPRTSSLIHRSLAVSSNNQAQAVDESSRRQADEELEELFGTVSSSPPSIPRRNPARVERRQFLIEKLAIAADKGKGKAMADIQESQGEQNRGNKGIEGLGLQLRYEAGIREAQKVGKGSRDIKVDENRGLGLQYCDGDEGRQRVTLEEEMLGHRDKAGTRFEDGSDVTIKEGGSRSEVVGSRPQARVPAVAQSSEPRPLPRTPKRLNNYTPQIKNSGTPEALIEELLEENYRGQGESLSRSTTLASIQSSAERSRSASLGQRSTPQTPVRHVTLPIIDPDSTPYHTPQTNQLVVRESVAAVQRRIQQTPSRAPVSSVTFEPYAVKTPSNNKKRKGKTPDSKSAYSPGLVNYGHHVVSDSATRPKPTIKRDPIFFFTKQEREDILKAVYEDPPTCTAHGTACTECYYKKFAYFENKTMATSIPVDERQKIIANNRSLRNIKNELENLLEQNAIDDDVYDTIMKALPTEASLNSASRKSAQPSAPSAPSAALSNLSLNNNAPPPSYRGPPALPGRNPSPAPPVKPEIARAMALYRYTAAGDCNFEVGDDISVSEYMNNEWWFGRNIRTGQEGVFPASYVQSKVNTNSPQPGYYGSEKTNSPYAGGYAPQQSQGPPPPGPSNPYNSAVPPMQIADQPVESKPGKGGEMGKKFGKKLGNAAIFGAGATIGGNIVNSIF